MKRFQHGVYDDPLASLTDEDLVRRPAAWGSDLHESADAWWEEFRTNLYNWNDPAFRRINTGLLAYRVIPLTKGYFMMVSPHDFERMTHYGDGKPKNWHAKIDRDKTTNEILNVYGRRRGRKREDEPPCVFAHRELVNCLNESGPVDHKNGYGLDNRRGTPEEAVNLKQVTCRENLHNQRIRQRAEKDLPMGVVRVGLKFEGKVSKRVGKTKRVISYRSENFDTAEQAAEWYRAKVAEFTNGRTDFAHDPKSVHQPFFPPRLEHQFGDASPRPVLVASNDEIPF